MDRLPDFVLADSALQCLATGTGHLHFWLISFLQRHVRPLEAVYKKKTTRLSFNILIGHHKYMYVFLANDIKLLKLVYEYYRSFWVL